MNFKKLIAATAMAFASISAQATLIDFESTGTAGSVNPLDYAIDGFVFNQGLFNIDTTPYPGTGPEHSGSFAALNLFNGVGEITKAGGGTFSFESLWVRSWYNSTSGGFISGWLNGAQVGSIHIAHGVRTLSWTQVTGNFASIDTLRIGFEDYFLLDDISLNSANISPVPEPETYAMLLAGLGLMGGIARRRKQTLARA